MNTGLLILKRLGRVIRTLPAFVSLLWLASCANHSTLYQAGSIDSLDEFARFYSERHNTAITYKVIHSKGLIHQAAFGYQGPEQSNPVTENTLFRWWSLSKVFTAIAVLQLQAEGKLDLDQPIGKYLPTLAEEHDSLKVLPIKLFLNHTSGMADTYPQVIGWMNSKPSDALSQSQFLKSLLPDYLPSDEPMAFPIYSDVNYMLLGQLIETVSGLGFQDYIQSKMLLPLGMKSSGFNFKKNSEVAVASHPLASVETLVLPFFYWDKTELLREIKLGRLWFESFYPKHDAPSGLLGSIDDLHAFCDALLTDRDPFFNFSLLMTMTQHAVPYQNNPDVRHAVSFKLFAGSPDYIQQNGTGPGYGALIRFYPKERIAVMLLTNDMKFPRLDFVHQLGQAVLVSHAGIKAFYP